MESNLDDTCPQLQQLSNLRKKLFEFGQAQAQQAAKWKKTLEAISALARIDWDAARKRTNECTDILVHRGWFISNWHTPLAALGQLARWVEDGEGETSDNWLADHFSTLLPTIAKEIERKFPHRYIVLSDAFEAHKQGKYNLSVPVILSQADGVGLEIFGVSPYSRKRENTELLRRWLEDNLMWENDSPYLWMIAELLPINRSIAPKDASSGSLNRHAVLHGLSSDFGTRINSCKALSWLLFVTDYTLYRNESDHGESEIPELKSTPPDTTP
jgi:hypothetical protein